jgi:hypothetical protein
MTQFRNVHGTPTNDGLVYVADRQNMRFQIFTRRKFLTEVFVRPDRRVCSGDARASRCGKPVHEHQRVVNTRCRSDASRFRLIPSSGTCTLPTGPPAGDRDESEDVRHPRHLRASRPCPGEFFCFTTLQWTEGKSLHG